MSRPWRDVNAIYQIYPRSFMDSNGDGIGDLRGVINKLDYLNGQKDSLGIDAIWFSPIFPSPMADFGYDVSDYCDIDPLFGTLDDFRELLTKAHQRNINVMVDFVPNHTSDQHSWFLESRSSLINDKRDYYVWADAKPDGSAPNNWLSIFGGSAWEFDVTSGQYYLHTFLKEQPDLNWDNPMVRDEMKRVVRFWLDMGVDGIRADAVRWISKDPQLRNDPKNPRYDKKTDTDIFNSLLHKNSRFGKKLFPYLREITDVVEEYPNRIMIFEDYPDGNYSTREQYLGFYDINPRVSMPFNFEGLWTEFYADAYRRLVTEFQGMLDPDAHTPVYCFSNHDQWRIVTRFGDEQARLIALMQFTLPGLPIVYYGDEIGMPNTDIKPEDVQDPTQWTNEGLNLGRDPERTPMQWNNSRFAGFSETKPWLPIGADLETNNVESQLSEPDSFLSLYRRLLKLRTRHDILKKGDYETFGELESDMFIFSRRLGDEHVFIVLNFSNSPQKTTIPHGGRVLCCSHPIDYPDITDEGEVSLRPFEGVLIECKKHPLTNKNNKK